MTMITVKREDSLSTTVCSEELTIEQCSITFNLDAAQKAVEILNSHPEFIGIDIPVDFQMFDSDGNPVEEIPGNMENYCVESAILSICKNGLLELMVIIKYLDHAFGGYFGSLENAMKESGYV